jgi:hypothetical protein
MREFLSGRQSADFRRRILPLPFDPVFFAVPRHSVCGSSGVVGSGWSGGEGGGKWSADHRCAPALLRSGIFRFGPPAGRVTTAVALDESGGGTHGLPAAIEARSDALAVSYADAEREGGFHLAGRWSGGIADRAE